HRSDLRALLRLALPIVVVQVGMMTMGLVDTVMVGHLSAIALAAVALGNLYFFGAIVFGMGVLMALDPVISQAVGAGDLEGVSRGLQRGLLLAAALCVPTTLVMLPAGALLSLLGQPPEIVPLAEGYIRISIPGVVGFYCFIVFRQTLQAIGRLRPIVWTILGANAVNALFNWMLIFGHWGAPALGVLGSAWATVAARSLMALGLLCLAWPQLRPHLSPVRPAVFDLPPLWRMLRLGAPIGFQFQLEYNVFGVIGLLMGWIGATQMAAHQVALNLASVTFMVPLGVSGAATVLVGQAIGRGDQAGAWEAAKAALLVGFTFMALSAVTLITVPGPIARLYTTVPGVVALAALLIPMAGIFQVFDGLQVVSIGILRGAGDTRTPMLINVLGFWLFGLPVSWYLGFRTGLGPLGLWWGLVVGLVVVALLLVLRVRARFRGTIRRVLIDHAPRTLPETDFPR
ncbi:MAG: MATE family efflux transporter, partial [Gemmatimonadales bacterium]